MFFFSELGEETVGVRSFVLAIGDLCSGLFEAML